jgi:hypothetical protein
MLYIDRVLGLYVNWRSAVLTGPFFYGLFYDAVSILGYIGSDGMVAVLWLRWLAASFPPWQSGFETKSGHVVFVVHKVALEQVFSKYFSFSTNSHSTECSILTCHLVLVQ